MEIKIGNTPAMKRAISQTFKRLMGLTEGEFRKQCGLRKRRNAAYCPICGSVIFRIEISGIYCDKCKKLTPYDYAGFMVQLINIKPKAVRKLKSTNKRLCGVRCTNGQSTLPKSGQRHIT
jgi:hypothetical protein